MQQAFDQIGKSYLRNMEQIQSEYPIEVAIGVEHGVSKSMDDIFKSADATMYQCKMKEERNHTGRNRQ